MKLVDDQGAIVEQYEYDPFGKQSVYDGTGNALGGSAYGVVYGFQGRRHDAETGLMYFRNRYYDPHLGRFFDGGSDWGLGGCGELGEWGGVCPRGSNSIYGSIRSRACQGSGLEER